MNTMKTSKVRSDERSSARLGVQTSRLICVSKDNLERLSTFRFHCERCNRWLSMLRSQTLKAKLLMKQFTLRDMKLKKKELKDRN